MELGTNVKYLQFYMMRSVSLITPFTASHQHIHIVAALFSQFHFTAQTPTCLAGGLTEITFKEYLGHKARV